MEDRQDCGEPAAWNCALCRGDYPVELAEVITSSAGTASVEVAPDVFGKWLEQESEIVGPIC